METVGGGVASPGGFRASGITCGLKKNRAPDLAMVFSDRPARVAGLYTQNKIKGNSLKLAMENAANGTARAVVINSGNANACNGVAGYSAAQEVCLASASLIGCRSTEIIFGSTGVIGYPLDMGKLIPGLNKAYCSLSEHGGSDAAGAIMTTDTFKKEIAVEFELDHGKARIGGMAKGSGMIHPDMATMISVLTTDVNIPGELLKASLKKACASTFNRISVDGDTSVCDMAVILANGNGDQLQIEKNSADHIKFIKVLTYVCEYLAKNIARDGEGATKLLEIRCINALTADDAYKVVSSVARSPLVKTAFFGMDANWGRIITAAGYSGAYMDESKTDIYIGGMHFFHDGSSIDFSEEEALAILSEKEITVTIDLNTGSYSDRMWTCDFSYDYIKINGSYRT